jgi:hypothetical protein
MKRWLLYSAAACAGVVLAVAAWGQPFVVPPQPVVVTNAGGTTAAQITATAGGSLQVECVAGCGGGGAVTANQGTPAVTANRWPVQLTDGVNLSLLTAAGRLTVDGSGVTQPVSGTVAATQSGAWTVTTTPPANASTNITQFGGNAVVTGTGASGVGIPRVTVSNDSTVILGAGAATIGALTANQSVNLTQIAGTGIVTGGVAGFQSIGGVSATNTAITQNPVLAGAETLAQGTQPAAATTGNQRRLLASLEGVLYVQEGNSNRFSCLVQAVTVTTQCQAAPGAGLRAYVTSAMLSNQAATVQTLDIIFGTGANCVTAPVALTHKIQFGTVATTTSPLFAPMQFTTPLVPTAANAICVRPSLATAFGATLTGFIAP